MDRRDFLKSAAATTAAVGAGLTDFEASAEAPNFKKMIGLQVGAVSFVDEGTEKTLDILQNEGGVNTLFIATFSYGRGIAGRQVPGQPLPDHGKQIYDTDFHGGCFTKYDKKYFADTPFKEFRSPDFGDYDVLEAVLPSARKRGMKTVAWFEDVFNKDQPGVQPLEEKMFNGQNAETNCFNNPYYRAWLSGIVENWARNYPLDGIMWGSERQGAFANMIGSNYGRAGLDKATCFCEHCQARAKKSGINFERVKAGFAATDKFMKAAQGKQRPVDGYYVELWRLMLRYPELLAWEMLWTDSLRDIYKLIYDKVKEVNPKIMVGWHIWHNNSMSPIYRAEQDLQAIAPVSDFLKMVMYHNCGGERLANYIDINTKATFADVPGQELLDFHYRVLDYPNEKSLAQIPLTGLSADYVYREAKRARAGLEGTKTLLWPGIDIDIPTAANHSKCTPKGTEDAVAAAFKANADGVILSRKYSEMMLANLKGAGNAVRKLGLA
jgi:hypothetical protein